MTVANFLLGFLVTIEFINMLIRIVKLVPPKDPPIDEQVRMRLYS